MAKTIENQENLKRAVRLGTPTSFLDAVSAVQVEGRPYFLIRRPDGFRLLSAVCPHKGGRVGDRGDVLECPQHGWQFDRGSGVCLNTPSAALAEVEVEQRDDVLFALLPTRRRWSSSSRVAPPAGLTFQLHAHACLEITNNGFTLLTDPWIWGPAFFGSWAPYPSPVVTPPEISPDAIWISHEHSDHFHESTLRLLPKDIPVYVPDFPNRRLPRKLAALGFQDVRAMPFGERLEIAPNFALTCFEPASLWNDAIVLAEIEGFRYLNVNDAGVNHRIARLVAPVDVMSSTFSPGASGYPLTWSHLSDDRKTEILEQSRSGVLEMLRDATESYGASALIPFASFFTLWHPSHRRYLGQMRRNSPQDVVEAFANSDVEVIDMIAGESWRPASGDRTFRGDRDGMFSLGRIVRWVKRNFDDSVFHQEFPEGDAVSRREIEEYLLRLNDVPDIIGCEDLSAVIRMADRPAEPRVAFEVSGGRLTVLGAPPEKPNVTIEMPAGVLARVILGDVSWDEAFIGYWCRFDRTPDVYHAGFWRLLQAPYYCRPARLAVPAAVDGIDSGSSIAHMLECYGEDADRVLRRYGLYCLGCQHAPSETLEHAAMKHGLTDVLLDRLVAELRFAVGGTNTTALLADAQA
jgi:CMP-N-acetylneuraminate monooxygenase